MRGNRSRRGVGAFFGHHKCGTRWIGDVVAQVCDESGLANWSTANAAPFADGDVARWAERCRIDVVTYTNADRCFLPEIGAIRAFHVVRDPRDICVSAYYSHRHSHSTEIWPQLAPVRARLDDMEIDEGIDFEIEFLEPVFSAMTAWDYDRPDVLELRFEDLVTDDVAELTRALDFIGLGPADARGLDGPSAPHVLAQKLRRRSGLRPSRRRLGRARIAEIIRSHGFAAKAGGRRPGDVDVTSHYRSGTPGDWRSHFTERHRARFSAAYPTLLCRLGYDER